MRGKDPNVPWGAVGAGARADLSGTADPSSPHKGTHRTPPRTPRPAQDETSGHQDQSTPPTPPWIALHRRKIKTFTSHSTLHLTRNKPSIHSSSPPRQPIKSTIKPLSATSHAAV